MRAKLLGVVAGLALFGALPQASADIIDVTFTGQARSTAPNFGDLPMSFTANFVFDTTLGTLQTDAIPSVALPGNNRLTGGNVSASLVLAGQGVGALSNWEVLGAQCSLLAGWIWFDWCQGRRPG